MNWVEYYESRARFYGRIVDACQVVCDVLCIVAVVFIIAAIVALA